MDTQSCLPCCFIRGKKCFGLCKNSQTGMMTDSLCTWYQPCRLLEHYKDEYLRSRYAVAAGGASTSAAAAGATPGGPSPSTSTAPSQAGGAIAGASSISMPRSASVSALAPAAAAGEAGPSGGPQGMCQIIAGGHTNMTS